MNKAGKKDVAPAWLFVVLIVAFVGVIVYIKGGASIVGASFFQTEDNCAEDKQFDLNIRSTDIFAATKTYVNDTWYLCEPGGKNCKEVGSSGGSAAGVKLTDAGVCKGEYELSLKADQNNSNGLEKIIHLSSERTNTPVVDLLDVEITQYGGLSVRCYDMQNGDWVDDNQDGTETDYERMDLGPIFYGSTDDSNTSKAIGANEKLRYKCEVKTTSANLQFGAYTRVHLDTGDDDDGTDWDELGISFKAHGPEGQGVKKLEASEMNANDISALSAYETHYELSKAVTETVTTIELEIPTGDDVNPDFSPTIRFTAVGGAGSYEDDAKPGTLLSKTSFRNDPSDTQLAATGTETFQISVS